MAKGEHVLEFLFLSLYYELDRLNSRAKKAGVVVFFCWQTILRSIELNRATNSYNVSSDAEFFCIKTVNGIFSFFL